MFKKLTNGDLNSISIADIFLCTILSFGATTARSYIYTEECHFSWSIVAAFILQLLILLLTTYLVRHNLIRLLDATDKIENRLIRIFGTFLNKPRGIILMTIMMFIIWLPTLISLYPGTVINDSWVELSQYSSYIKGSNCFTDHHPIFDTWLMGSIIVKTAIKTDNWHIALFIFVAIQAILTAFSFSLSVYYLKNRLNLNATIALILWLFYALMPIYPASIQTISKDAIFSWIYVLFVVMYIEIIRSKGESLKNIGFTASLVIITILCCLTKKVGMYVVFLSLTVLLLTKIKRKLIIIIPLLSIIGVMFVAMPRIQKDLCIEPGGKQEMFSLPFQMTARYVKYCGEDITQEEHDTIDKVLFYDELQEKYLTTNVDPIKHSFQKGEDKDYVEYIKLLPTLVSRHPIVCFQAINGMTCGWFSWYEYKPLMSMYWHTGLNPELIDERAAVRGFSDDSARRYDEVFDDLYNTPAGTLLLSYALYASLIPAFALGTTFRKGQIKHLIIFIPMFLSIALGCWLAPVSVHFEGVRYLYPLTYTTPLTLGYCLYIYKDKQGDNC